MIKFSALLSPVRIGLLAFAVILPLPLEGESSDSSKNSVKFGGNERVIKLDPKDLKHPKLAPKSYPADYQKFSTVIDHKVDSVTVFSDRAEINRVGNVSLEAGSHWFLLSHLPQNLDMSSLRVDLVNSSDKNARISQILVEEVFESQQVPAEVESQLNQL